MGRVEIQIRSVSTKDVKKVPAEYEHGECQIKLIDIVDHRR
jgi:hypothetical protein